MSMLRKSVEKLTADDYADFPIWEFTNDDEEHDDLSMAPVIELPVTDMGGRLIGTQVRLANGTFRLGTLGNLHLQDVEATKTYLMLSLHQDDDVFHLARYHDVDRDTHGPKALSEFLGLDIDDVFPISYDVSRFCLSHPSVTRNVIVADPPHKLDKQERSHLLSRLIQQDAHDRDAS
jgi:hypothetical protein